MSLPAGSGTPVKPRTPAQGKKRYSNDKIKNLTKIKMQEYIEGFFAQAGVNHDLLQIVSPSSVSFNIDRSFDQQTDPTQKKLQVARMVNDLRNILPCILIVDGGVVPMNQSIGMIGDAVVNGGQWYGYYPIFRKVPITIVLAARDQDSADEMSGVISLLFNELRNLAGGNYITGNQEQGESWVITLPNEGVPITGVQDIEVEGDPIERVFFAEAMMEVFYEDVVSVKQQLPEISGGGFTVGSSSIAGLLPVIQVPDTISINETVGVYIKNFQQQHRVVLSNSNVATLSHTMVLTPRGFGKVKIMVYDPAVADESKRVLAEKEVEII